MPVVALRASSEGRRGRALLSYVTHPFQLSDGNPELLRFSNIGMAHSIAQSLLGLGFDVDVIDYNDVSFVSPQGYDLAVVHGGVNFDHLRRNVIGGAKLIYYSTGSYWAFHNSAERKRFEALRQRRGISLPLDRFIAASEEDANAMADSIICLGNSLARETYSGFRRVSNINSAATPDGFFQNTDKDYDSGRRRFLFFGSAGSVHKGLDLVLEAFDGLDAELVVCGSLEPEFANEYRRELASSNVHLEGWVPQRSARFYELMRSCNCTLLPSASEGQPGGVIECMHRGLIPLLSAHAHIDTEGCGLTLEECTVEAIRDAAEDLMSRPVEWHAATAQGAYNAAVTRFVPETFRAAFTAEVLDVLADETHPPDRENVGVGCDGNSIQSHGAPTEILGNRRNLIAIDAVFFQWNNTGIARVWRSLLEQWSQDGFGEGVVILDRGRTAPRVPGLRYRDIPPFPAGGSLDTDRDELERACVEEGVSLFTSTYYTLPRETRSAFFAYDMIPEATGMDLNEADWARKRLAIQHASSYVAISESTANDLRRLHPEASSGRITIAHCGVDKSFSPPPPEEILAFREYSGAPEHYYLFVGSRGGYKNGRLLFEAFSILKGVRDPGLLLIGGSPSLEPEFHAALAGRNVLLANPDDDALRMAYSAAAALVFPSRYEGFGLPILEAMACGCPVIACRNSSIPEVGGDAIIYVGESDSRSLARSMANITRPSVRSDLAAKGIARAAGFSWSEMAAGVARHLSEAQAESS